MPTLLATIKQSSPSSVAHGHWKHAWTCALILSCQMLVGATYLVSWFQSMHPSWQTLRKTATWKQEHAAPAIYFMGDRKQKKEMQERSRVRYDIQGRTTNDFLHLDLPPIFHLLPIVPHISENMQCLSVCLFHLHNVLRLHSYFCNGRFLRLDVCVTFPLSIHMLIDIEANALPVVSRATQRIGMWYLFHTLISSLWGKYTEVRLLYLPDTCFVVVVVVDKRKSCFIYKAFATLNAEGKNAQFGRQG